MVGVVGVSLLQPCPFSRCSPQPCPTCPSLRLSPVSTQPLLLICGPTVFRGCPLWSCASLGVLAAVMLWYGELGQPVAGLCPWEYRASHSWVRAHLRHGDPGGSQQGWLSGKPGEAAVAHQPVTLGLGEGQEGLFLLGRGFLSLHWRTLGNAGLCGQVEGSTSGSSDTLFVCLYLGFYLRLR